MGESCVRKLDIERYGAGELTGAAASGLEDHLHSCPSCSAYLVQLKKERQEFLRAHPYREFRAAAFPEQAAGHWHKRFPLIFPFPVLRPVLVPAVCVLLVAVVIVPYMTKLAAPSGNDLRYKGGATLSYIYKRDGVVRSASPDDRFRGGDRVQVLYSSPGEQNLTLFSVDDRGFVSFYRPDTSARTCSIRCGAGSGLAYPKSIELDSAPGAELVVAVFSDEPFDTSQIKKWVAGLKIKGDLAALENAVKNNPPAKKSAALTLLLKKG
jgi:hypothetical protein